MTGETGIPATGDFVPGVRLAETFYHHAVRPILDRQYPGLKYSAALIGSGSDVLGYDTARSMDHEWGPRLQIFLTPADAIDLAPALHERFRHELPPEIAGYSTHFVAGAEPHIRHMRPHPGGPIDHKIDVHTLESLLDGCGLGAYPALSPVDWLTATDQTLLELTRGAVFHDGLGTLSPMRAVLAAYPADIWRYRLAARWARIGEMEAFLGRTAEVGDEIGSRLIAALLVRDVMHLAFQMERCYAPYPKWFGTAFARLGCAAALSPPLERALAAGDSASREAGIADAYRVLAWMHNGLAITPPMRIEPVDYFGRPYQVIFAGEFAAAIEETIADPAVRKLPRSAGGVDQFSDSTVVLQHHRERLRTFFREASGDGDRTEG